MGVYLHPMNQAESLLESLAGVPHGTAARLAELRRSLRVDYESIKEDEAAGALTADLLEERRQAEYDALVRGHWTVQQYDRFHMCGWGKLKPAAWAIVRGLRGEDPDCGRCTDPATAMALVRAQGWDPGTDPRLFAELVGGVTWS